MHRHFLKLTVIRNKFSSTTRRQWCFYANWSLIELIIILFQLQIRNLRMSKSGGGAGAGRGGGGGGSKGLGSGAAIMRSVSLFLASGRRASAPRKRATNTEGSSVHGYKSKRQHHMTTTATTSRTNKLPPRLLDYYNRRTHFNKLHFTIPHTILYFSYLLIMYHYYTYRY